MSTDSFEVVVNHEQQYSIWPCGRPHAPGWHGTGKTGSRDECLAHIAEIWTDQRPLSLRRWMDAQAVSPEHDPR